MTKAKIQEFFSKNEETIKKEYNVKTLALFGSYAADLNTDVSDIDILISFENPIGWKFFDFKHYLEDELGKKVDLVTPDALHWFVKDSILSEAEYIYE